MKHFLRYALTCLLFGLSIMFKQYSMLVFAGFLVSAWIDSKETGTAAIKPRSAMIALSFSALPFLAFIAFTKAGLVSSLYAFGFLGRVATSYIEAGYSNPVEMVKTILTRMMHMNWLFIPFVMYVLIFRKRYVGDSNTIVPIFIFSSLPIAVRQFCHYFQLIAPWSYIIMGIVSSKLMQQLNGGNKDNRYVLIGIFVCVFIILPSFLVFTPSFYSVHKSYIATVTLAFLFFAAVIVYAGLRLSGFGSNKDTIVAVIIALILFETAFLSLKLPFNQFRALKRSQIEEATIITRFFEKGSSVYIINYPQLYFTCKFKNPLNNYTMPITEKTLKTIDWSVIDNIITKRDSPVISSRELSEHGYMEIETPLLSNIALFKRSAKFKTD